MSRKIRVRDLSPPNMESFHWSQIVDQIGDLVLAEEEVPVLRFERCSDCQRVHPVVHPVIVVDPVAFERLENLVFDITGMRDFLSSEPEEELEPWEKRADWWKG